MSDPFDRLADASPALPPLPPRAAPPPAEPAAFPAGFWPRVDYLLHNRDRVLASLRADRDLGLLSGIFFRIGLVTCVLYGAVMGATNLLQGSELDLPHKLMQIGVSALKVPVLFLLTCAIVLPPIYVSNAFVGSRLSFRQMLAVLLSALAVTTTVLASMATVALFFALTSQSYDFLKLLHVLFFVYAGLAGLAYQRRCLRELMPAGASTGGLWVLWLVLYMFVGTQLAWVLRPFVGDPGTHFQVFRPRSGNFYESVTRSFGKMLDE